MSFLQKTIHITKEANKEYKMNRAEYERASNVLYDISERKIKKCVLQRAKDGYTDATFDVIIDFNLDIAAKWSIKELLFSIVFEDAPPVVSRLFYLSNSPFYGFAVSTKAGAKDEGPSSVFVLDWTHEMLQPIPGFSPSANPQTTPLANPQPALSADSHPPDVSLGNFSQQYTRPAEPQVQNLPDAPVNPVVRNIFAYTFLPPFTK